MHCVRGVSRTFSGGMDELSVLVSVLEAVQGLSLCGMRVNLGSGQFECCLSCLVGYVSVRAGFICAIFNFGFDRM